MAFLAPKPPKWGFGRVLLFEGIYCVANWSTTIELPLRHSVYLSVFYQLDRKQKVKCPPGRPVGQA
jgi:hypothetical protein